VGAGGEMNQALYAHMNNKRNRKKNKLQNHKKIKNKKISECQSGYREI
jgi:hypothetical protein